MNASVNSSEGRNTARANIKDIVWRDSVSAPDNSTMPPSGANICSRKVARSGHISYEGRPYFISKTLAGRYIRLVILADRLVVDASIPLHKEYPLV